MPGRLQRGSRRAAPLTGRLKLNTDSGDPKSLYRRSGRSLLTDRVRHHLGDAHRLEMTIVSAQRRIGDHPVACRVAQVGNWLGDGWVYLILGIALLAADSLRGWGVMLTAGLAIGLCHAVYPLIKRGVGRLRPFERMPQLMPSAPPLDRYSFPSGHCMTATAAAVPLVHAYPDLAWAAATVCTVIAWGRLACAHHYPSDLLGGCVLGALAAYSSAALLLALRLA